MGGGGEGETNVNCSAPALASNKGGMSGKPRTDSRSSPTRPCNLLMSPSNPFESYPSNVVVNVSSNVPLVHRAPRSLGSRASRSPSTQRMQTPTSR